MSDQKRQRIIDKVTKYVTRDSVHKLKSYVKKHKLDVATIRFDGGNLLHLACQNCQDASMRFLLKKGVDPLEADRDGNLPVHLALQQALGGHTYAYSDLALPLLKASPESLDVTNKKGASVRHLLNQLESEQSASRGISTSESSSSEDEWTKKLNQETQEEYSEMWGTYEQDFCEVDREPDTYDAWANRLYHQHRTKKYEQTYQQQETQAKRQKLYDEKQKEFQRKIDKEFLERAALYEKNKENEELKCELVRYEQKFDEFSKTKSTEKIGYLHIPWPVTKHSKFSLEAVLFCAIDKSDTVEYKKCIREQQVRWHPDKFTQKFGEQLKEKDRDRILKRVKEISQTLNKLSESIS